MLILLSPAKTLDMETPSRVAEPTMPAFMEDSKKLVDTLQSYSKDKLSELMHISDALASLNAERFSSWQPQFDTNNARPCIQAFRGDVYTGFDADTLDGGDLDFAQQHLRILSGLYGVMRPLDLMQAYRLEMGTSLQTAQGKSLYEFWGERLTEHLNAELDSDQNACVVNLASNEYFKSIKPNKLSAPLISPVFKDEKNGNYKIISFFAKKARGAMARNLVKTRAKGLDQVLNFTDLGYRFDEQSSSEGQPVFLRSEEAARPYLA
ncbi:peroxide stress protein YaaA [Granulosicoccus antarcticus]|uniref:UPF0246 protein IMCC3135_31665 n=1 Tax=Granulosicoccus antarcticus IMCC3135 TaxID=1192854 RepID=A0A2Z2P4K6_9GAMM|nr:peroxide stress protein YaaA [Granulosicoccus antarcticus]ASJ76380.1 hypothetical protein IMCC3135_31665 [Granulosicoccus antarcticus IMCC3135]